MWFFCTFGFVGIWIMRNQTELSSTAASWASRGCVRLHQNLRKAPGCSHSWQLKVWFALRAPVASPVLGREQGVRGQLSWLWVTRSDPAPFELEVNHEPFFLNCLYMQPSQEPGWTKACVQGNSGKWKGKTVWVWLNWVYLKQHPWIQPYSIYLASLFSLCCGFGFR